MAQNNFTEEEIAQATAQVDDDFTPDITDKEALDEVDRARRQAKWKKKRELAIEQMRRYQNQPVKLWQTMYQWLVDSNPDARKDIDGIIEECRQLRETRANKFARSKDIELRFGMRIPAIVLEAISLVDPRIREMETLDPSEAKKIYRQLEQAFPQFRIPKQD